MKIELAFRFKGEKTLYFSRPKIERAKSYYHHRQNQEIEDLIIITREQYEEMMNDPDN